MKKNEYNRDGGERVNSAATNNQKLSELQEMSIEGNRQGQILYQMKLQIVKLV